MATNLFSGAPHLHIKIYKLQDQLGKLIHKDVRKSSIASVNRNLLSWQPR